MQVVNTLENTLNFRIFWTISIFFSPTIRRKQEYTFHSNSKTLAINAVLILPYIFATDPCKINIMGSDILFCCTY